MYQFLSNESLNNSLWFSGAPLAAQKKKKKKQAVDAEYRAWSHFSYFSSQWIFIVIQAKGQLVSYVAVLDKAVLIVYFFFWSDSSFRSYGLFCFLLLDVIASY